MKGHQLIACIGEKYIRIEESERRIFELAAGNDLGIELIKEQTGAQSLPIIIKLFKAILNRAPSNQSNCNDVMDSWICFFRLGELYLLARQNKNRKWLITKTTYLKHYYPNLRHHNSELFKLLNSLADKNGGKK